MKIQEEILNQENGVVIYKQNFVSQSKQILTIEEFKNIQDMIYLEIVKLGKL